MKIQLANKMQILFAKWIKDQNSINLDKSIRNEYPEIKTWSTSWGTNEDYEFVPMKLNLEYPNNEIKVIHLCK